jgi:hypothetical protein
MNLSKHSFFAVLAGMVTWLIAAPARAQLADCIAIPSSPFTINAPGTYCLTSDLNVSLANGEAITIGSGNAVLDLNGHTLINLVGTPSAIGIYAVGGVNLTIRNGTVEGFSEGVALYSNPKRPASGNIVENLRVRQCSVIGIRADGDHNVVRRNLVRDLTGQTPIEVVGIETTGDSSIIEDNAIWNVSSYALSYALVGAYGIRAVGSDHRILNNDVNRINQPCCSFPGVATVGIGVNGTHGFVVGNRISYAIYGIQMSPNVKYRDNLTMTTVPFIGGGIDAGNNN